MTRSSVASKGEKTRQRLIEAAAYLFHRRGYSDVGLNDILKLARAPKGVLYHHFPGGKSALGIAAIKYSAELFDDQIKTAGTNAKSAAEYIIRLGELTAEDLTNTNFEAGCPLATIALETAPGHEALTEACREGFDLWLNTMSSELERLGDLNPRATSELLLTTLEGALAVARTHRDVAIVRNVSAKLANLAVE